MDTLPKPVNAQRKFIAALFVGSLLEWYDFGIFIFLFPTLAPIFFPHTLPHLASFYGYFTLAISYLIRPLGAVLFGSLGDRTLKSHVLILTLSLMALPSFLIGVLPTYAQIGIVAPLLLMLLRLLQGLSAGGELIGAILLTYEITQPPWRYALTNLVWMGSGIGLLIGAAVAFITTHATQVGTMTPYAWRIPFLIGGLLGLVGLVVRYYANSQKIFLPKVQTENTITVYINAKITLFKVVTAFAPIALIYYLGFFYTPSFMGYALAIDSQKSFAVNLIALVILQLLPIVVGYYYETIKFKLAKSLSVISMVIASIFMFHAFASGNFLLLIITKLTLATGLAFYAGLVLINTIEQLNIDHRYKILAFGYNLSYALFGNALPLLIIYSAMSLHFPQLFGIAITSLICLSWLCNRWLHQPIKILS